MNYNSVNEILSYFMQLQKYATTILVKINEAINTTNDTVILPIQNDSGVTINYKIPSFSNLERRITEIDRQFRALYFKDSNTTVDGKTLVISPTDIKDADVPIEFFSKPNYFFENLLNPLLYVKVDVSKYVSPSSTHLISRRMILNVDTDDKKQFFIKWFDKRKDLNYSDVENKLITEGIEYTIDEELLTLPPILLKYNGSFGIITIGAELNSTGNYSTVRTYVFDTLNYTEINADETTSSKILKPGDLLVTNDGYTFYSVITVDQDRYEVELGLENGYDVIPIGTDVLKIANPLEGTKDFDITVGPNEYQIVYLKPVDENKHITTENWSAGFAFKTEDLYIQLPEGQVLFDKYYKDQVNDYSKLFLGLSKEQTIPSIFVIKPDPPTLNVDNFKVHVLNEQTQDPAVLARQKGLIETRDNLETQKQELTSSINDDQKTLQEDRTLTNQQRTDLFTNITTKIDQKTSVVKQINSASNDIIQENQNLLNQDLPKPKVVVDGAWMPPDPKVSDVTGPQYPTHFNIRVTYLDKDGKAPQTVLINVKKDDGTIVPCYVPNFKIYTTPIRKWIKDALGNMVPEPLDLSNPTVKTITQLPVPIPIDVPSGEQIQLEVQTCIQTAGLPTDESVSDWSPPIIIKVPDDLRPSFNQETVLYDKIKYYADVDTRNKELDQLTLNQDKLTAQVALLNNLINNTSTTYQPIASFIISAIDLANKFILLPFMPFSYSSILVFIGATRAVYGTDFLLMGNRIDWGGLGLESVLQENSVLEVVNLGAQSNVNVGLSI